MRLSEEGSWFNPTSLSCTFHWFYSRYGSLRRQSVVLRCSLIREILRRSMSACFLRQPHVETPVVALFFRVIQLIEVPRTTSAFLNSSGPYCILPYARPMEPGGCGGCV